MAGPCIRLTPRASLSLSLALHELATNAMKYGALKNEEGWIDIEWSIDSGNTQPQLVFKWEERDGPPVVPPTRQGFGTRLIERGLAAELAAEVRTEYAPSGIVFTLKTALAEIQDKTEQES
jgi:two-component sensor histidine kinase